MTAPFVNETPAERYRRLYGGGADTTKVSLSPAAEAYRSKFGAPSAPEDAPPPAAAPRTARRLNPSERVVQKALNTFSFGLLPKIGGALAGAASAFPGGRSPREGYEQTKDAITEQLAETKRDHPVLNTIGGAGGLAGQVVAVPGGAIRQAAGTAGRIWQMARAGGVAGGVGGGASALAGAEGPLPEQMKQVGKGVLLGTGAGMALGPLADEAVGIAGRAIPRMAQSFRGAAVAPPLLSGAEAAAGRTATLPPAPGSVASRGRTAVVDAARTGRTNMPVARQERGALLPEIRRATPAIAHLGPEESAGVLQGGMRALSGIGRSVERSLTNLWRTRRSFGDQIEDLVVDRTGAVPVSPTVARRDLNEFLWEESERVPAFLDAIADAAATTNSVGRPAGFTQEYMESQLLPVVEAIADGTLPPEALREAQRALFLRMPVTLEFVHELSKSAARVASKGLQAGSKNTTVAAELDVISRALNERMAALPGVGPDLARALRGWREGTQMLSQTIQRTGASEGSRAGTFNVSAHGPGPGNIQTPEARFVADIFIPNSGPFLSSAGASAGVIGLARRVVPQWQKSALRDGARQLLYSGTRGDELLRNISARTSRDPRYRSPVYARLGGFAGPNAAAENP